MAKILQYGAPPPEAQKKEKGFFKYVLEENGGFFFSPNFVSFSPKIPKLVKLALEKNQKTISQFWVQKNTKFVGEKTTTTRLEKSEKNKLKKSEKKSKICNNNGKEVLGHL